MKILNNSNNIKKRIEFSEFYNISEEDPFDHFKIFH